MNEILDIKLDKNNKSFSVTTLINGKKENQRYFVNDSEINNIIKNIEQKLLNENEEIINKNKIYTMWKNISKILLAGGSVSTVILLLTVSNPGLYILLIFGALITSYLVSLGLENKNDVNRKQKIIELLKTIDEVDKYVNVKGLHKVKEATDQLSKSIQSRVEKVTSSVKSFSDDITEYRKEENNNSSRRTSHEELMKFDEEFRKKINKQIQDDRIEKDRIMNEAFARLEQTGNYNKFRKEQEKQLPQRRDFKNNPVIPYEMDDIYDRPDPEYETRRKR